MIQNFINSHVRRQRYKTIWREAVARVVWCNRLYAMCKRLCRQKQRTMVVMHLVSRGLPSELIIKICSNAHIYDMRKDGNTLKLFSYWNEERNTKRNELHLSTKVDNKIRLMYIYTKFWKTIYDDYDNYSEDESVEDESGEDESGEDESGEDESDSEDVS